MYWVIEFWSGGAADTDDDVEIAKDGELTFLDVVWFACWESESDKFNKSCRSIFKGIEGCFVFICRVRFPFEPPAILTFHKVNYTKIV